MGICAEPQNCDFGMPELSYGKSSRAQNLPAAVSVRFGLVAQFSARTNQTTLRFGASKTVFLAILVKSAIFGFELILAV